MANRDRTWKMILCKLSESGRKLVGSDSMMMTRMRVFFGRGFAAVIGRLREPRLKLYGNRSSDYKIRTQDSDNLIMKKVNNANE